jgi:hypothetical protein
VGSGEMKLIPYDRYELDTHKTVGEVKNQLEGLFARHPRSPLDGLLEDFNAKPLIGALTGSEFKVYRNVGYRNSFLPILVGSIYQDTDKTKLKIQMRLNFFVLAFSSVWFLGLTLISIFLILNSNLLFAGLAILILLIGYLLMSGLFWVEVKKLKDIINLLL